MKDFRISSRQVLIFLTLSSLVWIYIWLRAIFTPLIYDEIATFFHYIHTHNFLPFRSHLDANNHLLNSALTWICYELLGSSPLSLRLPNVLSFPLFAWFTFRFARHIVHPWLRWVFILSLLFAHNFLEFFALSRGYGISMAFLMASCWYLYTMQQRLSLKKYALALLFGILATAANLNLIFTQIIIVIIPAFWIAKGKFRDHTTSPFAVRYSLFTILMGLVPAALFILYLLQLKTHGLLYYGSTDGWFQASLHSLSEMLFGHQTLIIPIYAVMMLAAMIAAYFYLSYTSPRPHKWFDHRYLFLFLISGNLAAGWLAHVFFNINYHEARTALYYFPLFIGSVTFVADELMTRTGRTGYVIPILPIMLIPLHFLLSLNLSQASIENERIPNRFYHQVVSDPRPEGYPATIGGYRGREMQWAYLNFRNGGQAAPLQSADYPGSLADYQIVDIRENPDMIRTYDSVDYDPVTQFFLLKRKIRLERSLLADFQVVPSEKTTKEYIQLGQGNTDTLTGRSLYAGYCLSLYSAEKPLRAWIVFTIFDRNRQALRYERIPLDWLKTEWKGRKNELMNGFYLHQLPDDAYTYITYLWNIEKVPLQINDGICELYLMEEGWSP